MAIRKVLQKHDRYVTAVVKTFDDSLDPIIQQAQKKTLRELERRLTFAPDGSIERTPRNQFVLRQIDDIFRAEMQRAGYDDLVKAFSDQFADRHLPAFQDILRDISANLKAPLPEVELGTKDTQMLSSLALSARDQLMDVTTTVGIAAKRSALFGVAGLKFSDLIDVLADQIAKTRAQARTLADTATMGFYRTLTDQTCRKIEEDQPKGSIKYVYAGPDDSKTRPFCDGLLARMSASGPLTREEIDKLDNGQTAPGSVLTMCGGFNCRHQWIMDTSGIERRKAAA